MTVIISFSVNMYTARSSETLVSSRNITRYHNPEDDLNLKKYSVPCSFS